MQPERLSKLMARQGLCSRREADRYIERGWVMVDGEVVSTLGTKILPHQKITLNKQAKQTQDSRKTILINKPVGYVSGQPEDGYRAAIELVRPENCFDAKNTRGNPWSKSINLRGFAPAGRLDIDSPGLLVMTQDGRVAKKLIGENSGVEKEYLVRVQGQVTDKTLALLRHGLELDGRPLKPAKVTRLNDDQLKFILKEGRKRQIRRMCELVGLRAVGLKRVRIGNVRLGKLPEGQWRLLGQHESF